MIHMYIYFLIVTTSSPNASPVVIAKFSTMETCNAAMVEVETKSDGKRNMPWLRGICVKVES